MDNPAAQLFACLDDCMRLPALDARGTGGGVILSPEHIDTLLAAAHECFPVYPSAIREATLRAYLAPYIVQSKWRILYDCQRMPMLAALGYHDAPREATVLTGTPKKTKGRGKGRQAA